ncbi:MAG: GDP-L-fucose synthase [Verrucomicrobia bacterium]|nr:GDP-L-fucose synthase [Verrucomicrobiota bacterium]
MTRRARGDHRFRLVHVAINRLEFRFSFTLHCDSSLPGSARDSRAPFGDSPNALLDGCLRRVAANCTRVACAPQSTEPRGHRFHSFDELTIAHSWKRENATPAVQLDRSEKIYVAGHRGLLGGALVRLLRARGFERTIARSRSELDLGNAAAVCAFFKSERPAVVLLAAAKVGGIKANSDAPVEFLLENLRIQNNVISAAHEYGARKLVFLGSSCIYPKFAPQPIPERALLTGPLEPTNEAYAIAKIAGIKLCQSYARQYGENFISVMPTNLYGPGENLDPHTSHVLGALLRKAHEAKVSGAGEMVVWGTGEPRREFLHVDDAADAVLSLLENYHSPEIINVGCGEDITVHALARLICDVVGFNGELKFDRTKPDGTPRKLLDITKLRQLGWSPKIGLREGIACTYESLLAQSALQTMQ